ncbi:ABC transporter permease [Virgibacillus alimentarius]|uniref:ABC transport system permease protein n=1 Tax=Virgibacillus alimentarius TaxID=698769 RepID=A0ABS4SBP7_9BACI|nr:MULTISPECIES: FtsX-like permease family protein [Virgibacillus]MBP2258915.1 putative ABC transport system permease protein [Virgibacillus alimentarius]HLR69755.1 FtsX-like permease family protein [Virgibacillus sp.]
MLFKLSFSSMRKSFKDYLVLLFGLTISIAIFYMFQTLAQNKVFLESNAMISSIVFVFHVGTFILAAITIFYIFYATSFMLSMRQKEMGMYMTLGAKKYKVAQMMFFETFFIGMISLLIGIAIGIGLAEGIASLFMWQLDFSGEGFEAFYLSSIMTTVIFYVILFSLTSIVNAVKVARQSVLELLHADRKHDEVNTKGSRTIIGVFFAIALIAVGYYAMIHIDKLVQFGVILAAITITIGTYLIFISFLPYFIKKLKGIRTLNEKGLNAFTLAQLRFRVMNLTKVLGTVTMLIALGLGALTAGISFYHNIEKQSSMFQTNDVVVHQPSETDEEIIETLNITEQHEYRYKVKKDGVYFLKEDLLNNPPLIREFNPEIKEIPEPKSVATSLPAEKYAWNEDEQMKAMPEGWYTAISTELNTSFYMFGGRDIYIYDKTNFQKIDGKEQHVFTAMIEDFKEALPKLEKIDKGQQEIAASMTGEKPETTGSKYSNYVAIKGFSNGTIFMGFFLGVAFLMMMASVLMFKLLSSANADIQRYDMLRKIGVRRSVLTKSIYRELFLVFLFPAIIGLVHVLVGMQMFSFIIIEPYTKIWIPISIFILIYGIYYVMTVQMYKRIVLPKEE